MTTTIYREQILAEIDTIPDEYLPFILQLMRTFREGMTVNSAVASFRQGWNEVCRGETYPIDTLWDGIDDA